MGILARSVTDALRLGLGLAGAVLAMQAPALTREYAGALLQVAEAGERDIDQRVGSARLWYALPPELDATGVARALRPREPSNAETLDVSIAHIRAMREAYERIAGTPALLQPVTAAGDLLRDDDGKRAVLRTLLQTYAVQASFTASAASWALMGLLLGSLLAQLLLAALRGGAAMTIRHRPRARQPRSAAV